MIRRLFVAVELPPQTQTRLFAAAQRLRETAARARVTACGNFHITLAFIGETDREAAVRRAMERVRAEEFELELRGVGKFSGRDGDIWWVGAADRRLRSLHDGLAAALAAEGFAPDGRAFKPHLTLARGVIGAAGLDARALGLDVPVGVRVDHITLYESTRRDGRLCYVPLFRRPLSRTEGES